MQFDCVGRLCNERTVLQWVIRSRWCHKSPARGMERKCSMCCAVVAGQVVGSVRANPADPEIDTHASQTFSGKEKTHTSEHSLTFGALCTHVTARVVGGWRLSQGLCHKVSPNASCAPSPLVFQPLVFVCVSLCCSSWCDGSAVFGESTPITHLLTGL